MEGLADTIRSVLIFSGLSREDVAKVLGKMEEISFETGATIFSQGEQGDAFYLIQSGAVQVVLESGARQIRGSRDSRSARLVRRNGAALRGAAIGDHSYH